MPALRDAWRALRATPLVTAVAVLSLALGVGATTALFSIAVLGVPAALGRTFTPADDRRDGGPDGPVAVISHGFWQRRYGGAPGAVGGTRARCRHRGDDITWPPVQLCMPV